MSKLMNPNLTSLHFFSFSAELLVYLQSLALLCAVFASFSSLKTAKELLVSVMLARRSYI